jgi:hypothetical protein
MTDETIPPRREGEPEPPSFSDAIRFVYDRRVRIAAHFLVIACISLLAAGVWLYLQPRSAIGRIVLTFKGIEKGEYPSGRKFSTEDFRAPDVLRGALSDAGLKDGKIDLNDLSANMTVSPVIPPEVQARWKKQDRDGLRREEYSPNEFEVRIALKSVPPRTQLRLFDAIVKRYRDRVKFEQKAAIRFVSDWSRGGYKDLVRDYDYWEIPYILGQNVEILEKSLNRLIEESRDYTDTSAQLSFRDIAKDLAIWSSTRLEALRALTYKGRLVKNRAAALVTVEYRLEDLTIQARRKAEETAEAMRLLEAAGRPQPILAAQTNGRDTMPVVDASVMERIVKADYLTPLVQRISELQEETKDIEAKKWRLEKDATLLPQARDLSADQLPKEYKEVVEVLSRELAQILKNYNALLDRYLTETVTNFVAVKGPTIGWGFSLPLLFAGVLVLGAFLALFWVVLDHIVVSAVRRAR